MNAMIDFKHLCDQIIKEPKVNDIIQLKEKLKHVERRQLQQLQDYLLLPLVSQIDQIQSINNQEIKVFLISTITEVFKYTKIQKILPLKVVTSVLLKQIFDVNTTSLYPNLSEEIKISIIECIEMMLKNLSYDVITEFYTKENNILIARIIFITLHIIERETYKKLRLISIKCLMATFYVYDEAIDESDLVLREQVSNQVFVMLPKIVATLNNIIVGDEKQGQFLKSMAVKALGRILCLIFEDYNKQNIDYNVEPKHFKELISTVLNNNAKTNNQILGIYPKNESVEEKTKHLQALIKSPDWLEAAVKKLKFVLKGLIKIVGNKSELVRLELAILSCSILEKTSRNLMPHFLDLLQCAIALSQDEMPNISKLCIETLQNTNKNQYESLIDNIEAIFLSHLITLPRIVYAGDDDDQLAAILLLKGMLQNLAKTRLKTLLSCTDTMERFITFLLSFCELDRTMGLLQEEYSIRTFEENDIAQNLPWKEFRNINNRITVDYFVDVCHILGRSNAADLVFHHLMDLFMASDSNCNEILVILQFMLSLDGWGETERTKICLEELLNDKHWILDTQANRTTNLEMEEFGEQNWFYDRTEGLYESSVSIRFTDVHWKNDENPDLATKNSNLLSLSINEAKFNVQHICLVLETIGRFCVTLKDVFQPFLPKSLHRILQKSGSSNLAIHTAGNIALNNLKLGLNYPSISQLIHENSDYIGFYISNSLKKINENKNALEVLSVVLQYSNLESIPHLENIVNDVMAESSKPYYIKHITSFLKVFHMLLMGISKWAVTNTLQKKTESINDTGVDRELEICQKWINLIQYKDIIQDVDYSTEPSDNNMDTDEFENTKPKELPQHIQMTLIILNRCIKYISTRNKMDKCLAIDSIRIGIEIIQSFENELLPMVHAIWTPFVERFLEQDVVVLRKCFNLLIVLGRVANDFIYKRVKNDISPVVINFLKTTRVESASRCNDLSYTNTQQFKFLCEIFDELGDLLVNLEVTEQDIDQILDVSIPYLSQHHPKRIQEQCLQFIQKISKFEASAVYLKLLSYTDNKLFQNNVKSILDALL